MLRNIKIDFLLKDVPLTYIKVLKKNSNPKIMIILLFKDEKQAQ